MSLKPEDKDRKERRKSLTNDNNEISDIFTQKMQMSDAIKKYVSMKVNYQMKQFENKLADDLINRFLDELDKVTHDMIKKIEK